MIDPNTIKGAERIAFASSERGGGMRPRRDRWTEISVWYLHEDTAPGGKRWVTEIAGMTRIEGEFKRWDRFAAGTLERALKRLDDNGSMGLQVAEDAICWAAAHRPTIENGRGKAVTFADDEAALAWLYGEPDKGHRGYAKMIAADTGAGESTVRMQISAGRSVMVPLRSVLPFIDRDAFRRARGGENDRG